MYFYLFFKGFITGFTIAAIGGPVGLLCIRKSLHEGVLAGVALGVGAALGDALFGSVAGFGLTIISDALLTHERAIGLIGSIFLLALGIITLCDTAPIMPNSTPKGGTFLKNAITSFILTVTNPATILFFAAVSVSLGIGIQDYTAAMSMVIGIFIGSLCWFSGLAFFVSRYRLKVTPTTLAKVNKLFGALLMIFALWVGIKNMIR